MKYIRERGCHCDVGPSDVCDLWRWATSQRSSQDCGESECHTSSRTETAEKRWGWCLWTAHVYQSAQKLKCAGKCRQRCFFFLYMWWCIQQARLSSILQESKDPLWHIGCVSRTIALSVWCLWRWFSMVFVLMAWWMRRWFCWAHAIKKRMCVFQNTLRSHWSHSQSHWIHWKSDSFSPKSHCQAIPSHWMPLSSHSEPLRSATQQFRKATRSHRDPLEATEKSCSFFHIPSSRVTSVRHLHVCGWQGSVRSMFMVASARASFLVARVLWSVVPIAHASTAPKTATHIARNCYTPHPLLPTCRPPLSSSIPRRQPWRLWDLVVHLSIAPFVSEVRFFWQIVSLPWTSHATYCPLQHQTTMYSWNWRSTFPTQYPTVPTMLSKSGDIIKMRRYDSKWRRSESNNPITPTPRTPLMWNRTTPHEYRGLVST